jgi:hypothetical protein
MIVGMDFRPLCNLKVVSFSGEVPIYFLLHYEKLKLTNVI